LTISEIRGTSTSSEVKGESPEDTIRTFASYVDLIISRHPEAGFAEKTAWVLNQTDHPVPVLNGGSGPDQHPTQALLDIYTLEREFRTIGGLDGKKIAMVGDLKRGRTVRSLSYLMKNYKDVELVYVAPEVFKMKDDIKEFLSKHQIPFYETDDFESVMPEVDVNVNPNENVHVSCQP
jgi:aspartate carbamoyltransferase catalytic subunit